MTEYVNILPYSLSFWSEIFFSTSSGGLEPHSSDNPSSIVVIMTSLFKPILWDHSVAIELSFDICQHKNLLKCLTQPRKSFFSNRNNTREPIKGYLVIQGNSIFKWSSQ